LAAALGLAAIVMVALSSLSARDGHLGGPGVRTAHAQGGMDIDILSPSFTSLPVSVQPGQEFTISVATAPGARCVGTLTFRGQQPIELEATPAPSGACAWDVGVPLDARPGTGTVSVDLSRSGQHWALSGIVYVSPVGESR
jgi:hypothetical protein